MEILICGDEKERKYYYYNTDKDDCRLICEYPTKVDLSVYCVVKLTNKDKSGTKLLSFGGLRAVIGGNNNHLLFITNCQTKMSVFDLNIFQFIQYFNFNNQDNLFLQCLVLLKTNEQETMSNNNMILFKYKTGLLFKYDKSENSFQLNSLSVCRKRIHPGHKHWLSPSAYGRKKKVISLFFFISFIVCCDIILFETSMICNNKKLLRK
ncbi:hypothetical protein RFI_06327 [Reticulomyxa filosa]|uniref:Uncharacterized protein n=1 Tax=Reticulomyxa filosa TaxID=46433 RepID=X6NXU4_RETFI|nr:hypothetical protein RFI_06327 [Reticulomyxa filosa]|eukprot:ETO30801.1 hypothetical protein RFI_06327 [Reticulomyxa filosa]